ncbi:hypothetical protein, partial [Candidatus Weimeria sp. HCP3S3_B5]|uniref:hypothetical protein n=1 Tax=Candidatus Weimeria sp. HCP3S3_B5 TaxID=3438871 RepID=UPI003F8CDAD8
MSGEIIQKKMLPKYIEVRGAKVHNLKNINIDVPLNEIVAIAGVSGSGKSSLALGALYAEGSRRYLESLSTYTVKRQIISGGNGVLFSTISPLNGILFSVTAQSWRKKR